VAGDVGLAFHAGADVDGCALGASPGSGSATTDGASDGADEDGTECASCEWRTVIGVDGTEPRSDPCSDCARGVTMPYSASRMAGPAAPADEEVTTLTFDGVDVGYTLLPEPPPLVRRSADGGGNDPGSTPRKSPEMRAAVEILERAAVHLDAGVGGLPAAFLAFSSWSRRAASFACRMKSKSSSSSSLAERSSEPRLDREEPWVETPCSGLNRVDIRSAWFSKPLTRTSFMLVRGTAILALAAGERPMPILPPRGAIVSRRSGVRRLKCEGCFIIVRRKEGSESTVPQIV
jgi:hypothetical protein